MDEKITVTVKFKVKKEFVEDFKMELEDVLSEFIDESIAEVDGQIEVSD